MIASTKARVLAAVIWQPTRSGYWVCEIYDKRTGKFVSVGIGPKRTIAETRAYTIAHQNQSQNSASASPH
jgi:hypothetical protein